MRAVKKHRHNGDRQWKAVKNHNNNNDNNVRCYNKEPRHCATLGVSKGRGRSILGGLSTDSVREPLSAEAVEAAAPVPSFTDRANARWPLLFCLLGALRQNNRSLLRNGYSVIENSSTSATLKPIHC